jgi:hypothetical protein
MAKKINKKAKNKLLLDANLFPIGGFLNQLTGGEDADGNIEYGFLKGANANIASGVAKAAGVASNIASSAISGGLSSGAGNAMQSLGNIASAIPGPYGAIAGAALNVVGGLTNKMFGSQLNQENINNIKNNNLALATTDVDDSSNASILNQFASQDFGKDFSRSDVGKDGWFSNKAKKTYKRLKEQQALSRNALLANYDNAIDRADTSLDQNAAANFIKCGGALFSPYKSYAEGGELDMIDNGGSHEENPLGGVPVGVDAEGIPNLVEQGEAIDKKEDYVYSDTLKANERLLAAVNLPKKYAGKTFAAIAKDLNKEAESRPNDPISKNGVEDSMSRLQQAQELYKASMQVKQQGNKFKTGGWEEKGNNVANSYYDFSKNLLEDFGDTSNWLGKTSNSALSNPNYLLENKKVKTSKKEDKVTPWLRYVPALGGAFGYVHNLLNKPDYKNTTNAILEASKEAGTYTPISFKPIGNYLQYRPLDRNYYINTLNANNAATRSNLMNLAGANRANLMSGILAADYNAGMKLGDLARKAEEYNEGLKERGAAFNRGTDQFNSEGLLKAAMANQSALASARNAKFTGALEAAKLRDAMDTRRQAAMSANLTNVFNSLGDIGREAFIFNQINDNDALKYWYTNRNTGTTGYKGKNGGYLTLKNRRKKNG